MNIFVLFCTTLIISLNTEDAFGLKVQCGPTDYCLYSDITHSCKDINLRCGIHDIEVPAESEHLQFHIHGEQTNTTSYVEIFTKKDDRGLTAFPKEIFDIFTNVRGIKIRSKVKSLTPAEWRNPINLEILGVTENQITVIDTFNGLTNLEELQLGYNQITVIRRGTFVGVPKLQDIILCFNRIHTIEDGAFDTPELKSLNLDGNKLTVLSDIVFLNIPKLKSIAIDENELTHIGRSLLSLQNVVYVSLNDNHIEDIDLVEFSKLPSLNELNLDNSGFSFNSSMDLNGVSDNMSIKTLHLENNNLTNSNDLKQLRIFKGLNYLRLSNNLYKSFDLTADDIQSLFPDLIDLHLKTAGLRCEDLKQLKSQLRYLYITLEWCCKPACIE